MTDNEARVRELVIALRKQSAGGWLALTSDQAFACAKAALDAAYERGKAAGLTEARELVKPFLSADPTENVELDAIFSARLTALEADTPANRGEG